MKQWKVFNQEIVVKTVPFEVERLDVESESNKQKASFHRLLSPDWVNILPVTSDRKVLLIEQSRIGLLQNTLETPGGVLDPGELRDPTLAAARELEEETGFSSQRFLPLARIAANPATHSNHVHFFLALNCIPASPRKHFPDEHEEISVHAFELNEVEEMVRLGKVQSSYSALAIMLGLKYLKS